jgi:predicted chitinase
MTRAIDVVRKVAPLAKASYLAAFENGDALLQQHEINTPDRLAHFLAQVLHESGGLRYEWEGMNYRADRLLAIFGVGKHTAKITPAEASRLAGNPEAIAERVYGLGNPAKASELGNTNAGDGFRYRGGGLMQTTGRFNYRTIGEKCGVDFEGQPELVVSPEHALKPALAEWTAQKLNAFADADNILAISRAINLGNPRSTRTPNGLADRKEQLKNLRPLISGTLTFSGSSTALGAPPSTPGATSGGTMDLQEVQRRLKAMDLYTVEIDGEYGPATETAIKALFLYQAVSDFEGWSDLRKIIGAGQLFCRIDGIDVGAIDGQMGPQTREAFEIYAARALNNGSAVASIETWREEEPADVAAASTAPAPASTAPTWPRQSEVQSFFGAPGANQTMLILPFKMRLAWDLSKTVSKTSCNVKVHDHLQRIWKRTLDHYGPADIQRLRLDLFGGCLNVRKKRGGSTWSMHAYGIAWDVDPEHNALKMGRDDATLDGPEYDPFWGFVYDEGAISLGKERNFDWMHFQFARL